MGVFFVVCKKSTKVFYLLWIWIFLFQSYDGLEKTIWLLHWELFGDLHCWCFLISTMTFNFVIPHFSLARVWGLWNEQQKCHRDDEWKKMPLLCIWVTSSKLPQLGSHMVTTLKAFWGPTLPMLLEKHNDSQSCNSPLSLLQMCLSVFHNL